MDSRIEILRGIKSQLATGREDPAEQTWTSEQNWQAFSFLFMEQGQGSDHTMHNDDLLFFVHDVLQPQTQKAGHVSGLDPGPLSVRRRGKQTSSDVWGLTGSNFAAISWDRTLLLNIVLQTEYTMTDITCRWGG